MLHVVRFLVIAVMVALAAPRAEALTLNEGGLHVQPWFTESFMILREDIEDAAANNKRVAVIIEQRGCPYCKEMHEVNLAIPEIVDYIKANYSVIQLNMWGSREVTDLDGKQMEERELVRRWRVNFTPTIVYLPTPEELAKGEVEVARMPGYFKPFHFHTMFEFVKDGAYKSESFQRYAQEKFKRLEAEGKKPTL